MSLDRAVRAYQAIRAQRAELKKEYETADADLKGKLAELEMYFKQHMDEQGVGTFKTPDGTVYLQETMKANIADWGVFGAWVRENDALDFLQRRVVIGEVQKYIDEHEELPPGIDTYRERAIRVRRS